MRDVNRTATTKDVAAALGVKASTVQLYSRQSRIPFDRTPGGHRRYNVAEVRAALEVDEPSSRLAPMIAPGLGTGATATRSMMALMDAQRRAIVGEVLDDADAPEAATAALDLIGRSRRVLVAV